jgi:hypothetical protein
MTTEDIIILIFWYVDDEMKGEKKHSQAILYQA